MHYDLVSEQNQSDRLKSDVHVNLYEFYMIFKISFSSEESVGVLKAAKMSKIICKTFLNSLTT